MIDPATASAQWRVATVTAIRDETATVKTISFDVPGWPGHLGGQHVDLRLTAKDGYVAQRSYSIASGAGIEPRIELTVDAVPDGEVSEFLHQELRIGDRIELRGPIGSYFAWSAEHDHVRWNLGYYHWDYLEAYSADNAAFLSQPPQTTTTATNAVYGEITYLRPRMLGPEQGRRGKRN